jgi:hypothetical protein
MFVDYHVVVNPTEDISGRFVPEVQHITSNQAGVRINLELPGKAFIFSKPPAEVPFI